MNETKASLEHCIHSATSHSREPPYLLQELGDDLPGQFIDADVGTGLRSRCRAGIRGPRQRPPPSPGPAATSRPAVAVGLRHARHLQRQPIDRDILS